ncbi:acyl-CoA dehydrogenase family protein [Streptomyces sp. NPDC005574]|uniref:acyl-CoA dehydrogenase family protein n=1 Tax=Streptomyces sp. NPDC005574 TaxID=3156891 RepID=UPI0033A02D45
MRFLLTEDQRDLRDGVRGLLARRFDTAALRAAADAPRLDRALWRELGAAGFFALRLPEREGGVGLGLPETVLAFEEVGRVLLPGPLVATHLAAGGVPGAATGETVVTTVLGGLVEWLAEADVVTGDAEDAVPLRSLDPLTPVHRVGAAATGARGSAVARVSAGSASGSPPALSVPRGDGVDGAAAVPPATGSTGADPVAVLLTAAEQLGTAGRTCELAVQHARTREQFGRAIGSFQAVKHLCAGMLVRTEVARAAVYAAAVTAGPADIAAARLLADEAAVRGARDCLQVHGGMGFTWESEVHLHLKRAWVRARRCGGDAESQELLAADLLT